MIKEIKDLEKRVTALEKRLQKSPSHSKSSSKKEESSLTQDLDALMQKHSEVYKHGILFSGLAMPSENPNRLIRWSGSGGFNDSKDFETFLEKASAEDVSRFSSNFSSPEKMKIIKVLITDGPLTQKQILKAAEVSQGQFYHHIKELVNNKLVQKMKQDKYDLSPTGHVISVSFIGILHTFLK